MPTVKKSSAAAVEVVLEKEPMSLLEQSLQESAKKLPKTRLNMKLKAERLCCGVWEVAGTVSVEAYEQGGKLFFLNPVDMPEGWQKFSIQCKKD